MVRKVVPIDRRVRIDEWQIDGRIDGFRFSPLAIKNQLCASHRSPARR